MNTTTRERLLSAATRLFADAGYRGASVRDICNQARANPGAVSYHFGGKRQLYRSVLRKAAAGLSEMAPRDDSETAEADAPASSRDPLRAILRRIQADDTSLRLLLRDLADGGNVAVEALTPPLRTAFDRLSTALGADDSAHGRAESRLIFLEMAAPLFLLAAAWPVIAPALDLQPDQRDTLFAELLRRSRTGRGAASPDLGTRP